MDALLNRVLAQYRELKDRHVIRVGAAYAVAGWIAVQVAAVVFPALHLPRWTVTAAVLAALAGFPLALVLAWVVEPVREPLVSDSRDEDVAPAALREGSLDGELHGSVEGEGSGEGSAAGDVTHFRVVHPVGLLLFVVAVAGLGGWAAWQNRPVELSAFPTRGWIVLADFRSETSDTGLGPALSAGLELSLEQSPHVNLVPHGRVLDALRRMRRESGEALDPQTALEVARREGAHLVLVPTVTGVANRYRIGIRIEDPASGESLRTLTTRADGREDLLGALDRLAADVREVLGEPRLWLLRRNRPLERVTTSSLQALEQYSLGRRAHVRNNFADARRLYENAVREDSSFATAVASLGMLEYERFDRERGRELLERAVADVDDVSDRERYGILTSHAIVVEDDLEGAYAYQQALADLYPDSYVAHNNLGRIGYLLGRNREAVASYQRALDIYPALGVASTGLYYTLAFSLGRFDSAVVTARAAVEADSANAEAWMQLGMGLFALDSLESAVSAAARAVALAPDLEENRIRLVELYRFDERYADAEAVLRDMLAEDSTVHRVHYHLGAVLTAAGRPAEARPHFERHLAHWNARPEADLEPSDRFSRAVSLARLNDRDGAREALRQGVAADSTRFFDRARVRALLGHEMDALRLLRRAVEDGFRDFVSIALHPDFAPLRDRTAFQDFLRNGFSGGRSATSDGIVRQEAR